MKTIFGNPTILSGAHGAIPPRGGLEFISDAAGYKHGAPLALVGPKHKTNRQLRRSEMFIETS